MKAYTTILVCFLLAGLVLSGCGYYSTSGRKAGDIEKVYIPFLENETAEPEIEIEITHKFIEGLEHEGTLKVTPEENADAILEGSVVEYANIPLTFSNELQAEQYRVLIRLRVSLFNREENAYIWQDKTIKSQANYYLETTSEQTYEKALEDVYRDLVEAILSETVEEW